MAGRDDWLDEGIAVLVQHGSDALTIDGLCERLGKTKGSFYHHFKGIVGYKSALLEHFQNVWTTRFIELVESAPDMPPRDKLDALLEAVVTGGSPEPEVTIRSWAQRDEDARAALERVDRMRIEYVEGLLVAAGCAPEQARQVSQTLCLLVIGADLVVPRVEGDGLRTLCQYVLSTVQWP
ncbi:TetR/AcrR family transcriptional regulator [Actinokineospora sp. HUAS TT18]|uniref:TetR/AcrR family transcriptional regulator n=1 Tax=Actinokineospora sp. HUAS TT18 TaxID=3447451 RepID=UPI003F51E25A